jgi:hypothetical protein
MDPTPAVFYLSDLTDAKGDEVMLPLEPHVSAQAGSGGGYFETRGRLYQAFLNRAPRQVNVKTGWTRPLDALVAPGGKLDWLWGSESLCPSVDLGSRCSPLHLVWWKSFGPLLANKPALGDDWEPGYSAGVWRHKTEGAFMVKKEFLPAMSPLWHCLKVLPEVAADPNADNLILTSQGQAYPPIYGVNRGDIKGLYQELEQASVQKENMGELSLHWGVYSN